jgi:membrane associated rhomboid family serine protease
VSRRADVIQGPGGLPRPGKVLRVVLVLLLGLWLISALLVNWGNQGSEWFLLLAGNTSAIREGQAWRILSAPFLHVPTGTIGHIFSALLGLFFLGPSLESSFGSARFARFLFLTATLSYATQFGLSLLLGPEISSKLVPDMYFGAMPAVEAVAIAWANTFRGRTVNLFFVIPVSTGGLIAFVVGVNVMYLIAGAVPPSGHIALFAGMGWGYLLGGGTPSPLRALYLRYRLSRLETEARSERERRTKKSGLRVIQGGSKDTSGKRHDLH